MREKGRRERQTGEGKEEQKAGESRVMPLCRQEASLMGRKQFICAGKRSRENVMKGPHCGAETMHSTHTRKEKKRGTANMTTMSITGTLLRGYTGVYHSHTSKIQQATDNQSSV